MRRTTALVVATFALTVFIEGGPTSAQQPPRPSEPVQQLGDHLFRLGQIRIDTQQREITVPGSVNRVTLLEFVANMRGGAKAYESAITLNTDGIDFNVALLLIGLDASHARVPVRHFDPTPPEGDRVSLWIEWSRGAEHLRVPAEQLLYDKQTKQTIPTSAWVYTGSAILPDGRYLANLDGVMIGFVHSPSPIIEHVAGAGVNRYGSIVLNPNLGIEPDMPITLVVKAVGPATPQPR